MKLYPLWDLTVTFADKIIEHFAPNSELANISEDADEVILCIEDQDNLNGKSS